LPNNLVCSVTDNPSNPPESPAPGFLARFRTPISVALHAVAFALSMVSAFGLAYNFKIPSVEVYPLFGKLLALALPLKLLVFWGTRQYRGSWRYVGLRDLFGVVKASYISAFLFVLAYFVIENAWGRLHLGHSLLDPSGIFPQSIFLLDVAATIVLVSAARVAVRFYYEEVRAEQHGDLTRVLIVGAGDSGEALLREILRMPSIRYGVVGFVDDQATSQHARIHDVEILGKTSEIKEICKREDVEEVLIALPSATPKELRRVVELCQGTNVRFRTVPPAIDLIEGRVEVSQIRAVDIEDLLGRDPVELDTDAIGQVLKGKRIVVTGAGGSIGSEMCRQIARFAPERLILIEQAENSLFEIDRELRAAFPGLSIDPVVGDICDASRIRSVMLSASPSAVFHAAAHKHVPMMEINQGEAIKNNIVGTRTVADAAVEAGVAKFVMISTDKAVNPTSVMGCTKRVAEMYVQQLSGRSETQFVTVRFGNVLGSSGSVIPIFKQQIASGGPVTVTHPQMTRYFMTIPEAAQLVLQAGTMGQGGEIFVLDMGDPIRIVQLAEDMITLSGLRPGADIEIAFTGIRRGEKLFEELSIRGEDVSPTRHPKIGIWRTRPEDWDQLRGAMDDLVALADSGSPDAICAQLAKVVPEYRPAAASADQAGETGEVVAADAAFPEVGKPGADPALGV
jgi:FlaA1/EpsC-like NDP-sugar epimerase